MQPSRTIGVDSVEPAGIAQVQATVRFFTLFLFGFVICFVTFFL